MVCSRIVFVYVPSLYVYWIQYTLMPFAIIISMIFSKLLAPETPCTFWFVMVHMYGQLLPGLVVIHAPYPVEREAWWCWRIPSASGNRMSLFPKCIARPGCWLESSMVVSAICLEGLTCLCIYPRRWLKRCRLRLSLVIRVSVLNLTVVR